MSDQVSETLFVALFFFIPTSGEEPWLRRALRSSTSAHTRRQL